MTILLKDDPMFCDDRKTLYTVDRKNEDDNSIVNCHVRLIYRVYIYN